MAQYKPLRVGVDDKEAVSKMQQALNDTGKYDLAVDGIYGQKTEAAVKDYQTQNGLSADGVAADETLGHLYGIGTATAAGQNGAATASPQTGFAWKEQEDLDKAWQDYLDREVFSYDLAADPMYQQYRDQYIRQGQLAMEDTVGQAASLTGGYGNSYAQTVGQQTYQGYLQQLNNVLPELYSAAYDRYQAEGEALYNEIVLQEQRRQQAYAEQQDSRAELTDLIAMGYAPTDADLTAAGLTRDQATAIRSYYNPVTTATGGLYKNYDNGDLSQEAVAQLQTYLNTKYNAGLVVDGKYGIKSADAVKQHLNIYGVEDAYASVIQSSGSAAVDNALIHAGAIYRLNQIGYGDVSNLIPPVEWEMLKAAGDGREEVKNNATYKEYVEDYIAYQENIASQIYPWDD